MFSIGSTYGVTMSPKEVQRSRAELLAKVPASRQSAVTFDVRNFPTRTGALNFARQWLGQ